METQNVILFCRCVARCPVSVKEYHQLPRAFFESIEPEPGSSFACRSFKMAAFPFRWHFHPEVELTLILRGRGRRFVGDDISRFAERDLVLLGSNLPHTWESDSRARQAGECRSIVIQFRPDFLGGALGKPTGEFGAIADLLQRARRGLHFDARGRESAARAMQEMQSLPPLRRLTLLLEILDTLARDRRARPISSAGFHPAVAWKDQKRVTQVCGFLNSQFTRPIKLAEAADLAGLSDSAFARFFQRATGKQFTAYLSELRVGRACELMIETERKIAMIALESGFENLSHFNRTFLRAKGMTPREFRAAHGGGSKHFPHPAVQQFGRTAVVV
jgi:AraC-like DNA-binding protein